MSEPMSLIDVAQGLFDDYDHITEGCHGDPTMLSYVNEDLLWATLTGFADALCVALVAGSPAPSRDDVFEAVSLTYANYPPDRLGVFDAMTDAVMALLAQPSVPPTETDTIRSYSEFERRYFPETVAKREQNEAFRALLDEILDWLTGSKWAVDNQKATEWGLRVQEIEADRG